MNLVLSDCIHTFISYKPAALENSHAEKNTQSHTANASQQGTVKGKSWPAVPVYQKKEGAEEETTPDSTDVVQQKKQTPDPTRSHEPFQLQPDGKTNMLKTFPAVKASAPVQKKENTTGMPDQLKSGIEGLSGMDLSDVKVHYNSAQPAQLNAFAYAQGADIHIAPGQERHLPHEAWHVVQQKQGRVQPTMQMKGTVPVNDDKGLESEADTVGAKALQMKADTPAMASYVYQAKSSDVVQRVLTINDETKDDVFINGIPGEVLTTVRRKGVPATEIKFMLKSWASLSNAVKYEYPSVVAAVEAAVAACKDYKTFEDDDDNEAKITPYTDAGFKKGEIPVLFEMFGPADFEEFGYEPCPAILQTIYESHGGYRGIEKFAVANPDILRVFAECDFDNYADVLTEITLAKVAATVEGINNATRFKKLITKVTLQFVKALATPVAIELATKADAVMDGIKDNWTHLNKWVKNVTDLNTLITIVGAGYTYVQCANLAQLGSSAASVRAFQQGPYNYTYALLSQFTTEARKYGLPDEQMAVVASTPAVATTFAALRTRIHGTSLAYFDKDRDFEKWLNVVSNLMIDEGYTLNVGATVPLTATTSEDPVSVVDNAGDEQGTFVYHYHPEARAANVQSPHSSVSHLKPATGHLVNVRCRMESVPANIKAHFH